jgi:type I restriction enzyme, R subunit
MPHANTEDQLVEQPAIQVFAAMGWEPVSALDEVIGSAGTLGRETTAAVVLVSRLRAALERLNPTVPTEALAIAIETLVRNRSTMSLVAANREAYDLLKNGISVSVPDREHGGQKMERVRIIDWLNPLSGNDFLLVSQMTITGALYTCRPDLIGFVNGLPLVMVELKKPGIPAKQAFDDNLTSYKHPQNGIPDLFWYNAVLIASNGIESRVGTLTADWERFFDWKRVEREDEPRRVSLEVMLRGVCDPARLLDLVENFTLFSEEKSGLIKVIAQNHQMLGVNNAIPAMLAARAEGHGRGGVFWHTQGAGKSLSMVFFAQKILRKIEGNWTFVVVTDRVELDDQIAKTFKATGAVTEDESKMSHAGSGAELRILLRGNQRYVFTLIHKFQVPEMLSDRRDVIVLTDESHRSQYDTLAVNMRSALPKALFVAFTGTPLIAGEERTREVFGDYVSIYDFQQSVEDHATVRLFYENRTPALHLTNPDLNDDIYDAIEAADFGEEAEKKLERELGRQYHLLTRDDRLETVAKDIVSHFLGRGFQGKAMVVSIDKATALRMYDKVQTHWRAERDRVERELARVTAYDASYRADDVRDLQRRHERLMTTDMAVVVSPGQNEIEQMRALGIDVVPHRRRMHSEDLGEKFKDATDPLRLVFLCAMWLTGFDVPSCSTIYLDKPMRNHTLMQTIARANRVFPGKHSGLIVDYANVFASLEKALAIYAQGRGGATPVRDKQQLVEQLQQAVDAAVTFCGEHGTDIVEIEALPPASLDRLTKIGDAVDQLILPDPLRKDFLAHAKWASTLYEAVKPDPAVIAFTARVACLNVIAAAIRERTGEEVPDISRAMATINTLLDASIAADGFVIPAGPHGSSRNATIDVSAIDFEALANRFAQAKHKNVELERLRLAVRAQLDRLIRVNRTRADFQAKFEELIESYNAGSRSIDDLFKELLALSRTLSEEQERHVREQLTEDELTVFDLLTRPGPELTSAERDEVKKVARQLLQRVREALVIDWRERVQARAKVRDTIESTLDEGLPRAYTPEVFQTKCAVVFEHVFETFPDSGTAA